MTLHQGVATNGRVRLLLKLGSKRSPPPPPLLLLPFNHPSSPPCSYRPRRTGERKRKSVRGCIVGSDLSVLNLGKCSQFAIMMRDFVHANNNCSNNK